jgi:hypothetical protein
MGARGIKGDLLMNKKERDRKLFRVYRKVGLAFREICQDLDDVFLAEVSGDLHDINNKIYKKLEGG